MRVIMDEFDNVFLPYWKILDKFKILNIKTKNGHNRLCIDDTTAGY